VEILVLHPGALGDLILSLPALALLRGCHRQGAITLAGNSDYLEVIPAECADRTLSLATLPLHRLYAPQRLSPAEALPWRRYDRVVCWTGYGDPHFTANLLDIHPDARIAGWHPGAGETRHVSRIFADSLEPWVPRHKPLRPVKIQPGSFDERDAEEWLLERGWDRKSAVIAIHPGAGSPSKRWPLDRYCVLAQEILREPGRVLLVVEGPAEPGLAQVVAGGLRPEQTIPAQSLPIRLLAGVLSKCRFFVGNDSGIAHLAAGLGLASLILFGPTKPEHWAPPGERVRVLREEHNCDACACLPRSEHRCLGDIAVASVCQQMVELGFL